MRINTVLMCEEWEDSGKVPSQEGWQEASDEDGRWRARKNK